MSLVVQVFISDGDQCDHLSSGGSSTCGITKKKPLYSTYDKKYHGFNFVLARQVLKVINFFCET